MIGFTLGALVISLAGIWGLTFLAVNFDQLVNEKEKELLAEEAGE